MAPSVGDAWVAQLPVLNLCGWLNKMTTIAGMAKAKRGYSREFTSHGTSGKRYLLDDIPAGLWADVKVKAKREGVSLRALILQLLKDWLTR